MKKKTTGQLLMTAAGTAGTAAAAFLLCSAYEKKHAVVTKYEVEGEELPEAFDGMRVMFLSDLHSNTYGADNQKLIRMIEKEAPDLILIGGDMITAKKWSSEDFSAFEHILKAFSGKIPMYFGFGNHETRIRRDRKNYPGWYNHFVALLERHEITVLHNSSVSVHRGDSMIRISGIELTPRYYRAGSKVPLEEHYIEDRLGTIDSTMYDIVLVHSPLFLKEFSDWGADLVLAGHFHGGTVRLPGLGGVMTPQFQFFMDCCRGRQVCGKTTQIVSGGLGTHSINIRFMNRPEAVLVTLKRKEIT